MIPKLGVCYYPEHWPEEKWPEDAQRMAGLGLSVVRIGEFAWSRIEPEPGLIELDWLERAIDTLAKAGLEVVLGTPTACPPKWLVDQMPDMLPVDEAGCRRHFGSRRHYCFSHEGYREECKRIVSLLARRFGAHPAIIGWQTDNEYGCHETTLSYSPAALAAFRRWLAQRYKTPEALNQAWGNVFWSMDYRTFDEVDLPNSTVTEANPAHRLDFRRFSSAQVASFNRAQAGIIRAHAPGRAIIHNFMGRDTDFDHFEVGQELDVSSWDSYPLGFLEAKLNLPEPDKQALVRSGDPDFQAFHHDLYRAASKGRWWVMEQQCGPVNWAPYNPAPALGMVRLWTWEAIAHGAEAVCYFRWRQAPFAQEQMHSGLLRSDSAKAQGYCEAAQVASEIAQIGAIELEKGQAAIVFDYESQWAWEIQPQGRGFCYFQLVFEFYQALRQLGLTVDIVPPDTTSLDSYKYVAVPGLFAWNKTLLAALQSYKGIVLIGPRSGSKTAAFKIPEGLPPNLPAGLLDLKVAQVESLRPGCMVKAGVHGAFHIWRECVEPGSACGASMIGEDGWPALARQGRVFYLAGWPDKKLMQQVVLHTAAEAGLETVALPGALRLRRAKGLLFAFNYGKEPVDLRPLTRPGFDFNGAYLLGGPLLTAHDAAIIRQDG